MSQPAAFFATILGDMLRDAACPGDLHANGIIDVRDLLAVINQWGEPSDNDVDGDWTINVGDLLNIVSTWGDCWPVQAPYSN